MHNSLIMSECRTHNLAMSSPFGTVHREDAGSVKPRESCLYSDEKQVCITHIANWVTSAAFSKGAPPESTCFVTSSDEVYKEGRPYRKGTTEIVSELYFMYTVMKQLLTIGFHG